MAGTKAGTSLSLKDTLTTSLAQARDALPKDFNQARFVQNAIAMLNGNQTLIDFAKTNNNGMAQIQAGLMRAAYLGLDALSKECYLIPYKNTLNFMVDYRGAEKLCKKYSIRPIKDIYAKLVREGDEFEETITDSEPSITFKPKPFSTAPIIGAFAVATFKDGGMKYETMSLEELNKCRSKSTASKSMAWADFPEQMYVKTVLHRLCKHIELDFDSAEQRQEFDNDVAIETDVKEIRNNEIQQSANSEDFEPDVIDAEVKPVEEIPAPPFA